MKSTARSPTRLCLSAHAGCGGSERREPLRPPTTVHPDQIRTLVGPDGSLYAFDAAGNPADRAPSHGLPAPGRVSTWTAAACSIVTFGGKDAIGSARAYAAASAPAT